MDHRDVLKFWFSEVTPNQWFSKSAAFDQQIRDRFFSVHEAARSGELYSWRENAEGCLAEIIVLDQFSRNIFRDRHEAFQQDALALVLSQELVRRRLDRDLSIQQKAFAYMPYMHSESRAIHQLAVKLFALPGLEGNLEFEHRHKEIIDRFGRYPHRNEILGRRSTEEELDFLKTNPGF